MKKYNIVLWLFILIGFVSCEDDVTYEFKNLAHTTEGFLICKDVPCPEIHIDYVKLELPENLSRSVNGLVKRHILQSLNATDTLHMTIESATNEYINDGQVSYPESSVLSDAHSLEIDVTVNYTSNKILSLRAYDYHFSGGAHGYEAIVYYNFDPKTGAQVMDSALFDEEFYIFAKAYLKKLNPQESSLSRNPEQIGFSNEGVLLIFRNTDVMVSQQSKEFLVSWEEASPYVNL